MRVSIMLDELVTSGSSAKGIAMTELNVLWDAFPAATLWEIVSLIDLAADTAAGEESEDESQNHSTIW